MNSKELILAVAEMIKADPLGSKLHYPLRPRTTELYVDFGISIEDPFTVGGINFDIDVEYTDHDRRESKGSLTTRVHISSMSGDVGEIGQRLALANQIQELAKQIEVKYGSVITIDYWDE